MPQQGQAEYPSGPGYPTPAVPGNIQWYGRQRVKMPGPTGSYGTVYSASREENGQEVLFPMIYDGALHSQDEAWQHYQQTGQHMGKFNSVADADAYGQKYHEDAAAGKFDTKPMSTSAITPSQDQFQYIKLPDGSYGKFRADATDDEIKGHISKDFPDAYPAQPSLARRAYDAVNDFGYGVIKGAGNTVSGISEGIHKIPVVGPKIVPAEGLRGFHELNKPKNTAEKAGYLSEQVGEFFIPGPGEEAAAAKAASYVPKIARFVRPAVRTGLQAVDSGIQNKLQGGEFSTGAESSLVGSAIGAGARKVAPAIAESALGITKKMRGYGKTPGEAVLNEVKGVRPSTILKNASDKTGQLTNDIEGMAAAHPGTVSISPARKVVTDAVSKAASENNEGGIAQLKKVGGALEKNATTGLNLAPDQTATGALNLKRGLRKQFVSNWNPEMMHGTRAVAADASHAIDSELDAALGPKFSETNQRLSSLIPVAERAESLERAAPISERVLHRIGAHTGALVGAGLGAREGYEHGGVLGGIGGGAMGLIIPEIIASPTGEMIVARGINSPKLPTAIRSVALQADRLGDSEEVQRQRRR